MLDPDHDLISAAVAWVEQGHAPGAIVATKFRDDDATKGIAMKGRSAPIRRLRSITAKAIPTTRRIFLALSRDHEASKGKSGRIIALNKELKKQLIKAREIDGINIADAGRSSLKRSEGNEPQHRSS